MKLLWVVWSVLLFSGCGGFDIQPFDSLLYHHPKVVFVEPADGATVPNDAVISVEFSKPIDPFTVNSETLAIIKQEEMKKTIDEIASDVVDGRVAGIDGTYEFGADGILVMFRSAGPYEHGAKYMIVATGGITDEDLVPLNQRPGKSPQPFVSAFRILGSEEDGGISGGGGSGGTSGDESDDVDAGTQRDRPTELVINEVFYDIPGSDTNGDVFVELYGDAGSDITGYKINLVNGEDGVIKDTIEMKEEAIIPDDGIFLMADAKTGESGVSNVPDSELVDNFDPQNGPDCIQLLDDAGNLMDALGYGEPIVASSENGLSCHEGTPAPKVSSGQSLSRIDGADTGDNSRDFQALDEPTPGVM